MRALVTKWMGAAFGVMLGVHALAGEALASRTTPVPEISPTSITAGLALVAGGVLVLRSRRRK